MKYLASSQLVRHGEIELNRHNLTYLGRISILIIIILFTLTVHAEDAAYPELNDSDELSLMRTLSDHGLHDMKDERWNIYAQGTLIYLNGNRLLQQLIVI
jgi:hypothetical protein